MLLPAGVSLEWEVTADPLGTKDLALHATLAVTDVRTDGNTVTIVMRNDGTTEATIVTVEAICFADGAISGFAGAPFFGDILPGASDEASLVPKVPCEQIIVAAS
jgi:hypothetical protein